MRSMFMLASLVTMFAVACGDDGTDMPPGGNVDAPNNSQVDAPNNSQVDAPTNNGGKQLGDMCTPSAMDPAGDCGAGMLCLNLQGGSHAWCSKTCTQGAGDTCNMGYTGAGLGSCFLTVTPAGGGSPMQVCGIVCDDLTPMDSICPAAECNGTCPAALQCTANLNNQDGMTVAKGCQ